MNIQKLIEKIRPQTGLIIFIDLKQAYDSIPLDLLFKRLKERSVLNDIELQFLKAWYNKIRISIDVSNKASDVKEG